MFWFGYSMGILTGLVLVGFIMFFTQPNPVVSLVSSLFSTVLKLFTKGK